MTDVVIRVKLDKGSAVADARAVRTEVLAAFQGIQGKGLAGGAVTSGLAAATATELTKTTRAAAASMDQQKAAQYRGHQLLREDYQRYLEGQLAAEGAYNRRAIALGDALLRVQRQQAADAARARRQAIQAEDRQQRDENYVLRSAQISAQRGGSVREARGRLAGDAGTGLALGGGAVLGGLALATQQAGAFDAKLVEVRNNTQMTDAEFEAMRAHILSVGAATGASMEQMAEAFMRAKNHSFDLADSLKIVDAATKSALATGADVGETGNLLSQTMHIFRLNGDQATAAMNTLHMASLQGNMTMSDLVQNFGLAEAVTSKYGLSLQDTAAAFATMTENGLNAAEAGTQVRDVMQHLTAPAKGARAEIARLSRQYPELGADIKALKDGSGSLTKTMIDLNAATGGQAVEIQRLIPAQRGSFGAMALTGKAADDLKRNYEGLAATMAGKVDPTMDGFLRQQNTLSAQEQRLANDAKALSVTLGNDLTPVVMAGADALGGMARSFEALAPANQRLLVDGTLVVGVLALLAGGGLKAAASIVSLMADMKAAGLAFGGMQAAAEGATAAEGAFAAEGVTGLAAAGPWGLAIAAAVLLIGGIVIAWNQAKDAQDKYAKQKLDAQNAVSTPDTRTNIRAQAGQNNAEADRQQKLLDQLQATPNGLITPRDPAHNRFEDTVGPAQVGGRGGLSEQAVQRLRAQQIAHLTQNIAGLRRDSAALTSDGAATSDLGNSKRNYLREVDNAAKSQARITARLAALDKEIADALAHPVNNTREQTQLARMTAERSQQQANYDALERDKRKNQKSADYLGTLEAADRAKHGGAGTGEDVGMAIAQAAFRRQLDGSARAFQHKCEGLAHDTYSSVTGAYAKILGGGGPDNSALKTLARFQAAGLARPFTPGMTLAPGSLLYSRTMGAGDGHVQTIGPAGQRLDQYGTNRFAEKNFQFYVPPPTGKVGDAAPATPSTPGDAGGDDKAAKDRAQALVESAGLDADKAGAAFDHCKSEYARTGDDAYLVLAKAARLKLRGAQMAKARVALRNAQAEAQKDGTGGAAAGVQFQSAKFQADTSYTSDITGLNDQIRGTPKDRANAAFDVAIGRKEAQLQHVQQQIDHYRRALDRQNDPQLADALGNAYRSQKALEDDKAGIEYKKASFSSPRDAAVLAQKRTLAASASQQALDQNLLELAQKRLDAFTRILDVQKAQREEQDRLLEAQAAAPGVTDAQRADLRARKYGNDLADIGDQFTRDRASLTPSVKDGARDKFNAALATLNTEYTSGTTESADEALRRHADLLHTQADATDVLSEKMRLLTEYFQTLSQVKGMTPEQSAALGIEANSTLTGVQRDINAQSGQLAIGAGLKAHDRDAVERGLQILGGNAISGTDTQRSLGRADYLDTVKGLGTSGAITPGEALLRVQGVRDASRTPAEMAAATDAARQILDKLLAEKGREIAALKSPEARQNAYRREIAQVQANPDIPGEVKHDAVAGLQAQADSHRNRDKLAVGGADFWKSMTEDAGREGGDLVRALLNPKDRKNIGRQFWGWLAATGENALAGVVSSSIQNALAGSISGNGVKSAFGGIEKIFAGAKGSLLEGAAGIYGAAMALGAGGKQKQKHSIFGAILGGIAGSFLGPVGAFKGAEFGSALGGMFADGGRYPTGVPILVGERGPEIVNFDRPGTVIPNHGIQAFMRQAATPQTRPTSFAAGSTGPVTGGASAGSTGPVTGGASAGSTDASVTINQTGDHHYHAEMDLQKANRDLARSMERARRGGVPTSV